MPLLSLFVTCISAMRSFGASAVLIFGAVDSKCGWSFKCFSLAAACPN